MSFKEISVKDLKDNGIKCAIFDGVIPNPTIQNIEDGLKMYNDNDCGGIIRSPSAMPRTSSPNTKNSRWRQNGE